MSKRFLTKDEERALADPCLGKAFKLAFINNCKTMGEKLAFQIVVEKMLDYLDDGDILIIGSHTGIDMRRPFREPDWSRKEDELAYREWWEARTKKPPEPKP